MAVRGVRGCNARMHAAHRPLWREVDIGRMALAGDRATDAKEGSAFRWSASERVSAVIAHCGGEYVEIYFGYLRSGW